MSDAALPTTTATTAATTPAAAPAHQRARRAGTDAAVTTRRWAVGVLVVATTALALYLVALLAAVWLFAVAWGAVTSERASVDVLSVARDVAPALLVGWCTGLAASAVLARGEALGPRLAGVAAGALGTASGAAVLALTGPLL